MSIIKVDYGSLDGGGTPTRETITLQTNVVYDTGVKASDISMLGCFKSLSSTSYAFGYFENGEMTFSSVGYYMTIAVDSTSGNVTLTYVQTGGITFEMFYY